MHNSGDDVFDQPKCHPKTRITFLRNIMQWIQHHEPSDVSSSPSSSVLWVCGDTGVGKTAIARSIAEQCEELGLLLATFFFSRTVKGRDNTKQFVSTIAYQLAQTVPTTLQHIDRAVEKDPSIFDKTLKHQVQTLIVHPLKLSNSFPKQTTSALLKSFTMAPPSLLVIDGLDECDDALAHIQVLKILGSLLHDLPLKIVITSRPERHIRSAFETGSLSKLATKLVLLNNDDSDHDIRLFLSSEFNEIKESHPFRSTIPSTSASWPPESIIQTLVKKSAGQFIFAAVVIKFVASFDHPPNERLMDVLTLCEENCTTTRIMQLLDRELVSSNSRISDLSSDNQGPPPPYRTRSASPFPSHLSSSSSNSEEYHRASSEPSFDRTARQGLTLSCPLPGCEAIFTRHLAFKIHLRIHKEEKNSHNNNNSRRYRSSSSSSPGPSGRPKTLVNKSDGQKRHTRRDYDHLKFQSAQCTGCRRRFPDIDALDRHLKSEIGVACSKVVEGCSKVVNCQHQHGWEMEMDVDMDKGIGTTEMEVD